MAGEFGSVYHVAVYSMLLFSTSMFIALAVMYNMEGSVNFNTVSNRTIMKKDTYRRHYICLTDHGRLGNYIFRYASAYGISKLNNLTILLGEEDELVKYFELPSAEIRKKKDVCETFIEISEEHCCYFDNKLMKLDNDKSYFLKDYLQSYKYFSHVYEDVRKELTFKTHIKKPATYVVENYRQAHTVKNSRNATIVGVHIRRGDILIENYTYSDGVIFADQFLRHSIDYFLKRFQNVVFIVCCIDMAYAKRVMDYRNVTVHFVYISPVQDMAVLASCDHLISTVGTFGYWSGFFTGGTVVYHKYPIREGSLARLEYNYIDRFPPHWVALT